ncbi:MAG: phospholipase A [Myxococcota bacterium]
MSLLFLALALLSSDGGVPLADSLIERPEKPDHFEGYRPTYFLFGDNSDQVLFQFSFRYNIWPTDGSVQVFFGYTQRSWWELYDFDNSSPFVENNYSPELIFRWRYRTKSQLVEGFDQLQFGYQHQSNGESSNRSRGWDRIYVEQRYVHYFGEPSLSTPAIRAYLRVWALFGIDDFNNDIDDFAGPGELIVDVTSGDTRLGRFEAELLLRKGGYNLRFDNGTVQTGLRWIPAWPDWVKFTPGVYLQAFFGTFQSLERYNIRDDAVRIGIYFDT